MSDTPRSDAIWNAKGEEGDCESALYALCQELEREVEMWNRRWNSLKWCHSGCGEDRQSSGGGPMIGGLGW